MAIIIRCDICDKTSEEKKTYFSTDPLVTTVPGANNKNFRVSLFFEIVDEEDHALQEQISHMTDEQLYGLVLEGGAIRFKTPNPHVCESCKNYILHEWMINAHLEHGFVFDSDVGNTMFIDKDRNLKLLQHTKKVKRRKKRKGPADTNVSDKIAKKEARRIRRKQRKEQQDEKSRDEIKDRKPESGDSAQA